MSTLSSDTLFNPNLGIIDVIATVFEIFRARWGVIIPLIAIQAVTTMILGLVLGIIFAFAIMGSANMYQNRARHLVQHVASGKSAHRYLGEQYSWSDYGDDYYMSDVFDSLGSALIPFICFVAVAAVVAAVINSVFTGAMIRVAAEAYTESTPSVKDSLSYGWGLKFKILGFSILFFLGNLCAGFLVVILPMILAGDVSQAVFVIQILIFSLLSSAVKSVIIAGIPSIVVEKNGIIAAYKRSWELCSKKIFFIFGCVLCLVVIEILVTLTISQFSEGLANFFGLVFPPLFSIMSVVIYMTLRMQTEELTSSILTTELSGVSSDFVAISGDEVASNKDGAAAQVV